MRNRIAGITFAILLLSTAAAIAAEGLRPAAGMPPGKWWSRPEIVKQLGLTKEQRDKLDEIFRSTASTLIDLKGDVEKRTIDLRGQLDQEQLNRQAIQAAATRLNEARGKLFERELMMLVDMRGVLTPEQWNQFRDTLEDGPERMGPPRDRGPRMRPPQQAPGDGRRPRM